MCSDLLEPDLIQMLCMSSPSHVSSPPPRDPVSQFMEQSAIDDAICRLIFTDLLHEHSE